ncbi:hypothetical protein ACFQZC_14645 [Streptacidiphilus monticola]
MDQGESREIRLQPGEFGLRALRAQRLPGPGVVQQPGAAQLAEQPAEPAHRHAEPPGLGHESGQLPAAVQQVEQGQLGPGRPEQPDVLGPDAELQRLGVAPRAAEGGFQTRTHRNLPGIAQERLPRIADKARKLSTGL